MTGEVRDTRRASVESAEDWDTRRWQIFEDCRADGVREVDAHKIADRECAEQFGDRPEEQG